ncbi:MAG: beta-ketoacyl-ACP synthase II [Chitinivibrionales bacterium]|nr:beta-ketoacyl-ACP synthase II [Chitinivibrionales bacterium]
MSRRIVVTGMGVVSPVGNNCADFWTSLIQGKSGIDRITLFDTTDYPVKIAGEVRGVDYSTVLDAKEVRRTDRYILHGIYASDEAIKSARLDLKNVNLERCGVVFGSGIGGIITFETEMEKLVQRGPKRVSPFLIPMMIPDMAAGMIAIQHGFKGPNYAVVSACASAAHAIGDAFMALRSGLMDCVITGGAEATVCRIGVAGFSSMKALSTRNDNPSKASSPFDKKRDGFVMGEGSGVLILETLDHAQARKAPILAEIVGYGASCDAFHLSQPAPEGEGAQRCMRAALNMAGVAIEKVGYINAHGTSTEFNDKYESVAIAKVFGDYAQTVNISSTKSMTGHLLGASGAVEAIASIFALRTSMIPPTINYEDPDPECSLNYTPNKAVQRPLEYVLTNNFGFGGHNASLVIKKYETSE